uniref:Fascin domain-containing protein n=1 Tax=Meloidogyne hapla TaxID=6305 RepID=A0A1I8C086_MELHA
MDRDMDQTWDKYVKNNSEYWLCFNRCNARGKINEDGNFELTVQHEEYCISAPFDEDANYKINEYGNRIIFEKYLFSKHKNRESWLCFNRCNARGKINVDGNFELTVQHEEYCISAPFDEANFTTPKTNIPVQHDGDY